MVSSPVATRLTREFPKELGTMLHADPPTAELVAWPLPFQGTEVRFAANVVHAEAAERTEQPLGVNRARDSRIARGDALRRMQ